MIKKLPLLVLLMCCWAGTQAQSIGLLDLINLTSLKPEQIDDYFVSTRMFRYHSQQDGPEFTIKHYRTYEKDAKPEEVITGAGNKTSSGAILYTVSYLCNDPKYLVNLINQTKSVGLKLTFQGADAEYNIYIYDNTLYHAVFKLNFSQTVATCDITQKIVFTQ